MPDSEVNTDLWDQYQVEITLKEPLLGTIPKNKDIYADHVRDKIRAQEDEVPPESFSELEEKGWTSFYTVSEDDLRPVIMDYQFKGFLKEAGNVLKDVLKVKALRSHVESTVFVFPRKTVLADIPDGVIERPLRAMTMQGPRVSLTRSDYINAGRSYTFQLRVLKGSKVTEQVLRGIMEYGEVRGLLQWRNGGYGSFTSTLTKVS